MGKTLKGTGEILLLSVTYCHWSVEHVQGHHRNVGPKELATARLGESFYALPTLDIWWATLTLY